MTSVTFCPAVMFDATIEPVAFGTSVNTSANDASTVIAALGVRAATSLMNRPVVVQVVNTAVDGVVAPIAVEFMFVADKFVAEQVVNTAVDGVVAPIAVEFIFVADRLVADAVVNTAVDGVVAPIVIPLIVPLTSVAFPVALNVVNTAVDGVVAPIAVLSMFVADKFVADAVVNTAVDGVVAPIVLLLIVVPVIVPLVTAATAPTTGLTLNVLPSDVVTVVPVGKLMSDAVP